MPYVVALTGGIGSGKSTISHSFAKYGIDIIDADVIARQVVEPGQPALKAITAHFGSQILQVDGVLNREALRQIIFSKLEEKAWLDRLLHPIIHTKTQKKIMSSRSPWCLWVAPLLLENHLEKFANRVLVVDVDHSIQIERIVARDCITRKLAEKIISTQSTNIERLIVADDVLENNGHFEELEPILIELHRHYLTLSKKRKENL